MRFRTLLTACALAACGLITAQAASAGEVRTIDRITGSSYYPYDLLTDGATGDGRFLWSTDGELKYCLVPKGTLDCAPTVITTSLGGFVRWPRLTTNSSLPAGEIYAVFSVVGGPNEGTWRARSTDNGRTWPVVEIRRLSTTPGERRPRPTQGPGSNQIIDWVSGSTTGAFQVLDLNAVTPRTAPPTAIPNGGYAVSDVRYVARAGATFIATARTSSSELSPKVLAWWSGDGVTWNGPTVVADAQTMVYAPPTDATKFPWMVIGSQGYIGGNRLGVSGGAFQPLNPMTISTWTDARALIHAGLSPDGNALTVLRADTFQDRMTILSTTGAAGGGVAFSERVIRRESVANWGSRAMVSPANDGSGWMIGDAYEGSTPVIRITDLSEAPAPAPAPPATPVIPPSSPPPPATNPCVGFVDTIAPAMNVGAETPRLAGVLARRPVSLLIYPSETATVDLRLRVILRRGSLTRSVTLGSFNRVMPGPWRHPVAIPPTAAGLRSLRAQLAQRFRVIGYHVDGTVRDAAGNGRRIVKRLGTLPTPHTPAPVETPASDCHPGIDRTLPTIAIDRATIIRLRDLRALRPIDVLATASEPGTVSAKMTLRASLPPIRPGGARRPVTITLASIGATDFDHVDTGWTFRPIAAGVRRMTTILRTPGVRGITWAISGRVTDRAGNVRPYSQRSTPRP